MWLINTTTLELEFFVNPEKASYAILSHTWGDEEVLFQEFRNPDRKNSKYGFTKIVRTCEIARQQGLRYAWVDTCCIDKSSSAELSEAINSMFAWYKNSAVCLAHLEDFPGDVFFEQGLARCRWLSRGWTLQELIAPQHVEFYDQTWTKRATKLDSTKLLAKETGVNERVLADCAHLAHLSVAQRMSWVSRRQTTRAEDIAYCMLGMFDIHMPLIYGEGDKAFMRLQEEIAKQTCDLSLFAWTAPPPEPSSDSHNYRGIFAKSPGEFVDCHRMGSGNRIVPHKEFTITNRGLRIEATLIKLVEASPDDLVLNLGVFYRGSDEWPIDSGDGWIGIYVRKSIHGYVRVWSHRLYVSGEHGRMRCPKTMLHICKNIGRYDMELLQRQYARAIQILSLPADINISQAQPSDLWDNQKGLFLDPGSGLNAYFVLTVSANEYHAAFHAVLACSTMGYPTCVMWSEQDQGWDEVCLFLNQAEEVTDYVCVDYLLRDFVPKKKWKVTAATCDFIDRRIGCHITLEARISRAIVEGSNGFSVELSKRLRKNVLRGNESSALPQPAMEMDWSGVD